MPPQRLSAAARGGPEAARGYPDRSTVADGRVELALAFRIAHGPKPRLSSTPVMVPPTVSGVRCLSACTVRQRDEVPVQRAFCMILQKALLRTQRRRGRRPASHRSTTRPGLGGPGRVRRPRAAASVAAPEPPLLSSLPAAEPPRCVVQPPFRAAGTAASLGVDGKVARRGVGAFQVIVFAGQDPLSTALTVGRLPTYGDERASPAATQVPRMPAGRTLVLHDASALSPSGGGWLRVVRRSGRGRPRRSVRGGRIPIGARWH